MRTHALVVQAKITISMKEQNGKKMSVLTFALVSKGCGHLIFCSTHAAEKNIILLRPETYGYRHTSDWLARCHVILDRTLSSLGEVRRHLGGDLRSCYACSCVGSNTLEIIDLFHRLHENRCQNQASNKGV